MPPTATIHDVLEMARQLSPLEKLKVIEQLTPDLEAALTSEAEARQLDDQYQRGYEQFPEDATDAQALLPHIPLSEERWE